jgi:divalent metal cation (Fe/Co/Zn/Cd) transporter
MSTQGGTKAVIAALLANTGIAISKFVAFFITGSTSMLSEAIHSVADSLNQILLLIGGKRSKREANEQYQFGYGRVRYVHGFIVAIVLFLVGGLYSALSFRTSITEANHARGKRSMAKFIRDARQPELPVIILEDFGALIGLVFALTGVTLAVTTEDGRWDGLGAIAIGILLIVIAFVLIREMASMLIGESALPEEVESVKVALNSAPVVTSLIHLRTLHVGPDELLVAAKIGVSSALTAEQIVRGIDEAEALLRKSVPTAKYVFLEPDFQRV